MRSPYALPGFDIPPAHMTLAVDLLPEWRAVMQRFTDAITEVGRAAEHLDLDALGRVLEAYHRHHPPPAPVALHKGRRRSYGRTRRWRR